jgi:hypothetical protein
MNPRILASSLLLFSIAGCGQTVTPLPTSPDDSQALTTACTALYDSYVTWTKGCTGVQPARAEIEDLAAGCAARAALPGIEVTAKALLSCSAKVTASSCAALPLECLTRAEGYEDARVSLTNVVSSIVENGSIYQLFPRTKGKLTLGLACNFGAQCSSGTCGAGKDCGVCVELKDPGEACDATATCRVGSQCNDGVCVDLRKPLGEMCFTGKEQFVCQAGLYCTGEACATVLGVGDACSGNLSNECGPSATCDASICQAITIGHAGDACDDVAARCIEGTFCQDGSCHVPVANVPLNGSCGVDVCALGLNCNYGHCAPPLKAGAHCLSWEECGGGNYCQTDASSTTFCAAPIHEGEACGATPWCEPGLFCDATTKRCRRNVDEGAACDDAVPCRLPFTCRDGLCGDALCSAP